MLGGFAAALVFVITLVFLALVFFFVFTHAAHAYLAAVQDTAGGIDDVRLPRDPLGDRLDSAAHLGWLLVLWLAPAALLSRALRHDWLPDAGALRFLLLAAPGLWLFFPVALLSSLSATSRWVPFRPAVLWQMARTFPSVLGFYLITGLLLAGCAALWYFALLGGRGVYLLPVAAAAGAAVVLIHARLLGRVGWLIARLKQPARPAPKPAPRPAGKRARSAPRRKVEVDDPWAPPSDPDPAPGTGGRPPLPVEGYGLAEEGPAKVPDFWSEPAGKPAKKKSRPGPPKEEPAPTLPEEGYGVADLPPAPARGAPARKEDVAPGRPPTHASAEELNQPLSALELRLLQRGQDEYVPPSPLFSRVYGFPWYPHCLNAWLWLAIGLLAWGAGLRSLLSSPLV